MTESGPVRRYRFGTFEADAVTGELRRQGIRIKLNAQPFQVLLMLLERPGEVLTREEIARALWSDDTFVDYDHGVNSAVNRIRDALGDTASSPRFVETLARRGYRFVAPVETLAGQSELPPSPASTAEKEPANASIFSGNGILASNEELPTTSHNVVQALFLLLQLMYLGFYVGALTNLAEIEELISPLPRTTLILYGLIGTAAILIPVRAFVFCAVLFRAPGVQTQIPQDVARFADCRRGLGAVAVSVDASHQCRTCAGLHGLAGLCTLCAALAHAYGCWSEKDRALRQTRGVVNFRDAQS